MLFKEIVGGRKHARTDDGRRTLKDHKSSLSTSCLGELKTKLVCNWQKQIGQNVTRREDIVSASVFNIHTGLVVSVSEIGVNSP